jgi:hypothetical protein
MMLLSHPQGVFLVFPFLILYALFRLFAVSQIKLSVLKEKITLSKSAFLFLILSLSISLLLSAYWWLPYFDQGGYMISATYSLNDVSRLSPSMLEVILLRPLNRLVPSFSFEGFSAYTTVIGFIVPLLALVGIVNHVKNKFVIFFSAATLISFAFAIGSNFPLSIYEFCFKNVPLFNGMRAPYRFLTFACFSISILATFGVAALLKKPSKRIGRILMVLAVCALVTFSIGIETYQGFSTFTLSQDQKDGMNWLSTNGGDSVMVPYPRDTMIQLDLDHYAVNPWYYSSLTGVTTISGGSTEHATRGDSSFTLKDLQNDTSNYYGIRYVVFDYNYLNYYTPGTLKSVNSLYRYMMNESTKYELVWIEDNVTIFENTEAYPKFYLSSTTQNGNSLYSSSVNYEEVNPQKYQVHISAVADNSSLIFIQSYFPNWVAKDSATGQIIKAEPNIDNFCTFNLNKGEHTLIVSYTASLRELIGITVSGLTLAICLLLLSYSMYKRHQSRHGVAY